MSTTFTSFFKTTMLLQSIETMSGTFGAQRRAVRGMSGNHPGASQSPGHGLNRLQMAGLALLSSSPAKAQKASVHPYSLAA